MIEDSLMFQLNENSEIILEYSDVKDPEEKIGKAIFSINKEKLCRPIQYDNIIPKMSEIQSNSM